MQEKARKIVMDYFNKHVDVTDKKQITMDVDKMENNTKEVKMHTYIGTKTVKAYPKKAWKDAGSHKMGDEGYKVIYEDGYESWSPKDVFEIHYKKADTYIDRMNNEYTELQERIKKIGNFLNTKASKLNSVEYVLMKEQYNAMSTYIEILHARILYAIDKEQKNTNTCSGVME